MQEHPRTKIAVYCDLENIPKDLNFKNLIDSISLGIDDESMPVFAIKLACGQAEAIKPFRDQLRDLNFEIREAPHTANKKNKADLILTVEAFESLYQKNPDIDIYVFITSDTDFTVIMDKLGKYGKRVWLVTKECEKDKPIFTSCTDKILVLETFFTDAKKMERSKSQVQSILTDLFFTPEECKAIESAMDSFEKDKWQTGSAFGNKVRSIIKDFSYDGKGVKSQNQLFEKFKEKGIIETRKDGSQNDFFRIIL